MSALYKSRLALICGVTGSLGLFVSARAMAAAFLFFSFLLLLSLFLPPDPPLPALGKLDEHERDEWEERVKTIRAAEDQVREEVGNDRYVELIPRVRELVAAHPHYLPSSATVKGYKRAIADVVALAEYEDKKEGK